MSVGRLVVEAEHSLIQSGGRARSRSSCAIWVSWSGPGATFTSTKLVGVLVLGPVAGGLAIWAPTPRPVGVKLPCPKNGNKPRPTISIGKLEGAWGVLAQHGAWNSAVMVCPTCR